MTILSIVCFLSPGLILSGLYPRKKSELNLYLDIFSISLAHISSVHPGKTVDSYIIMFPLLIFFAIVRVAFNKGLKSGFLSESIGVGTVTM